MTPISLAPPGSALYDALRQYKWLHRPATARRRQHQLATLLDAFVERHRRCVAPRGWELVTIVPSLRQPATRHPLAAVVGATSQLGQARFDLRVGPGAPALGRARTAEDAFVVDPKDWPRLRGRRVLVIDDLLTTGAHLQAACAAVRSAGAAAVAGLVVGRRMAPGWSDDPVLAWARQADHQWTVERCARCHTR